MEEKDLEFLNNLPLDNEELRVKVNGFIFQEKENIERLELRLRQFSDSESSRKELVEDEKRDDNEEEEEGEEERMIDIEELRKKWDEVVDDTLVGHITELEKLKNEHVQLEKMFTLFEDLETMNHVLNNLTENNLEDVHKLTDIFSALNAYPNVQKWAMKKIHAVLSMIGQNLKSLLRENLKILNWGIAKFSLPKSSDFQDHMTKFIPQILKGLVNLQVIKETCTVHPEQRKLDNNKKTSQPQLTMLEVLEDLSFEILVRMNFHFFGEKNTNRSDRPSFIFTYVQILRERYVPIIHLWMNPIMRDLYKFKSHLFEEEEEEISETSRKKIRYFIEPTIAFTNLIHKVVIKRLRKQLGVLAPLILSRMEEKDEENEGEEEEDRRRRKLSSKKKDDVEEEEEERNGKKSKKKDDENEEEEEEDDRTDENLFMSWMNHAIEYEKRILEEFSYFGSPYDRGLESIVTEVLRGGGMVQKKKNHQIILKCFLWLERERIVEMVRKVYNDWKPYHDYNDDDEDDDHKLLEEERKSLYLLDHPQQQQQGRRNQDISIMDGEFMYFSLKPSKSAYKVIHTLSLLNERYKLIIHVKTRKLFYEEIHCYVLRDFLRFFSNNLDRHLSSNVEEEEMEWRYFCSMINSALYCETNLRLWDKIPQIMDFSTVRKKKKKSDDDDGKESIYYFSDLADRFVICADMMTRNLIRSVMDYVKYYLANKYERKLKRKRLDGSEITSLAKNVKKILVVCQANLERLRFNKIWRNLAEQVDLFFLSHFKIKDERDVDYEIRYQLLADIKTFFEIVFSGFTRRTLNFAKRTKKYIEKMN